MIRRRVGNKVLGFGAEVQGEVAFQNQEDYLQHVEPEDLLTYGLIPEFIGRLPIVSVLKPLTEDELVHILTDVKNAMTKQYQKLFAMEGVNLEFTRDALRALAQEAIKKGTGARALRAILERMMLDLMYEIPSREDVSSVIISRAVVEGRRPPIVRKKQEKDVA